MDILFYTPPIVENIFRHLPARDLSSCAQVCKLWSSMSATELKRRTNISWFFEVNLKDIHNDRCEDSVSVCKENSTFESNLQKQLNDLRVKTAFCMAFATQPLLEEFDLYFPSYDPGQPEKKAKIDRSFHKRKYLKLAMNTALKSNLPHCSTLSFTVAPGVIGSIKPSLSLDHQIPLESEGGSALSGFCFPNIPGVEIHHLSIDNPKSDLSALIPKETKIKCFLLFLTPRGANIVNRIVQSLVVREDGKVSVGGAIVDRTESLLGSAIVFSGENVESASLIITPKDRTEEIRNKLQIFKETGLTKNPCCAFMFACVARGHSLYRRYHYESSVFNSIYPQIPLIGVFGNGEIGLNYFPFVPADNKCLRQNKLDRPIKMYMHSYTTVFVLISIKK